MELSLDTTTAAYQIRSYQTGKIQVNENWYERSLIITPQQLILDWPPQQLQELQSAHLSPLLQLHPDVVILGSGTTLHFPPLELLAPFYNEKIGIEIMDTGAACRTYTALAAEGRNVAAALLIR